MAVGHAVNRHHRRPSAKDGTPFRRVIRETLPFVRRWLGRRPGVNIFSSPSAVPPSVAWAEGPAMGAPAELLVLSATSPSMSSSSGASHSTTLGKTSSSAISKRFSAQLVASEGTASTVQQPVEPRANTHYIKRRFVV